LAVLDYPVGKEHHRFVLQLDLLRQHFQLQTVRSDEFDVVAGFAVQVRAVVLVVRALFLQLRDLFVHYYH
jgi:hypothetical protein